MRPFPAAAATALIITLSMMASGCGSTDSPDGDDQTADAGPKVVASTSWVAAFAKAAGATEVTVIAPASAQHPPDYDPKPTDLAAVARADYVLFAEFDGFAKKLKDAAEGSGELVPVEVENTPAKIRSEVTRLGQLFGTSDRATAWLSAFDTEYAKLTGSLKGAPGTGRTAVSHLFMAYWGEFAGLQVIGTYGPRPVTPSELSTLTEKKPAVLLANAHVPGGNPEIAGAAVVELTNYPGTDLDLLSVFRTNAERLGSVLSGQTPAPAQ